MQQQNFESPLALNKLSQVIHFKMVAVKYSSLCSYRSRLKTIPLMVFLAFPFQRPKVLKFYPQTPMISLSRDRSLAARKCQLGKRVSP